MAIEQNEREWVLKKGRGVMRLIHAAKYSYQGLKTVYQREAAFRQELWIGVPLMLWSMFMDISRVEHVLLVLSLVAVLVAELLNSAIELVVDRVGTDWHPLSGQAKDVGSAVVLLTIGMAVLVWVMVLWV